MKAKKDKYDYRDTHEELYGIILQIGVMTNTI